MSIKHKLASIAIFVFSIASTPLFAASGGDYPELTKEEAKRYEQQLNDQIHAAEEKVQKLLQEMSNSNHIISSADRIELANARTMLKVKITLVGNFVGTPSLRSPVIRERLLNILKKDRVEMSDLYELQTLVNQERAKIDLEDKSKQQ